MLYLDELSRSSIDIKIRDECPSINANEIMCLFLPDLDVRKRFETGVKRIGNGHFKFSLDIPNIEPCRLFYKIVIPTRFIREIAVKFRKCGNNKISLELPAFRKELYEVKISVKTADGVREYDDISFKGNKLICSSISRRVLGKTVKIRLYSRETPRKISLGWRSIAVSKRRPKIKVTQSCACTSGFCAVLREKPDLDASSLIPHSITLDFKNATPPEVHIANKISHTPYHVNHFFLFSQGKGFADRNEIDIELYFRDEHSHLRPKADLYSHITAKPRLGRKDCVLLGTITKILNSSQRIELNSLPDRSRIVDKAPISIVVKFPENMKELLTETTQHLYVKWHLLHWGRKWHGNPISTDVIFPTTEFQIQPEQLAKALQIEKKSMNFEGILEATVFVELKEGWRVPISQVILDIKRTKEYTRKVFDSKRMPSVINKYIHKQPEITRQIMEIIYDKISKNQSYQTLDRQTFLRSFEWGFFCFPGTFGDSSTEYQGFLLTTDEADSLLNEITEIIAEETTASFLEDPNQPKVESSFVLSELRTMIRESLDRATRTSGEGLIVFPNLIISQLGLSA